MAKISRNSLQWQSAVNTFTSIVLAGFITILASAYIVYSKLELVQIPESELILYHSIALILLVIFALLFSIRSYIELSKPLNNLEQITHAMPLLSSKKYDDAKTIFNQVAGSSKHQEINQLQFATYQLTNLLQKLDTDVSHRSQSIHSKNEELQQERDFIKSLLDTAQLIVLTIDENFEITLFNDYGEKVTGYKESEILSSDVARMFPAGNWTEAQMLFKELLEGNMHIGQQDAELIDAQGHIKQISWLHSRIDNSKQNAAILSVGLDMTEKTEADKRVVWLAEHDPLTDLCNRRKFTEEFEKSLQAAVRYKHHNSLLFLDLDQFKDINDTSGHRAGDELLQSVAKTLNSTTRFTDLVARLGGDEFAVLMPESDVEGAEVFAQKIIDELAKIELSYGAVKHKVSTSIGIVHYPLHDADIHELLGFADLAMYRAKSQGKSRFHTFSPDDNTQEQLETRVYWKHQIENALENNNFILNYQPIMDIAKAQVTHYEILIRMRDPKSGKISMPGKFIEIAEEVGLIHRIDHFVLQRGIIKLANLQKKGISAKFAINLSGSVVDDPLLIPLLKQFIKESEVDPRGLIFEVTETAAVSNLQQAKKMMTAIKALGCQFALDDFGVGFSSFNYMRELPVDIIKIDGIFIRNLENNEADQLFVKALADVAKGLGKKTIAEFVESEKTLNLLAKFGIDYGQGYHIGKPMLEPNYDNSPSVFNNGKAIEESAFPSTDSV